MTTEQGGSTASGAARATFGTVLFIAWGVLSILWVYDAIYKLAHGEPESGDRGGGRTPADARARGHGGPGSGYDP